MGVPKFYRWVSERYPCLSEVVKEFQLPEFDNLYLDMNGIIHVCSHPDDENPHFRITEEKIFKDICHYIDFLFRMIKPRRVFYMAVDGVAPRAKMNQQRGRRFRSAREAETQIKKTEEKGEVLPTEKRFDSNCITPGTPFMVLLQEHLKYFVVDKITNDPLWQGPKIYLSGHETPGEGEHKVMDFIRYSKSQADYDPDTRHCLYGLDADLIMLGLTSHEPHFSLLREEVRFGGKRDKNRRPPTPEETTFHLLHLSLMRDYLAYEFSDLQGKLSFPWDLEKIIDDWILMGFLVGNDFIPHLPHLHIHHDALPLLWKTYKNVLPTLDGYINEAGHLNLPRFEKYFEELSKFDLETFESAFSDLRFLESKLGGKRINESIGTSKYKKLEKFKVERNGNPFCALEGHSANNDIDSEESDVDSNDIDECDDEEDDDDYNTTGDEFSLHKRDYYMNKMKYSEVTPEVLESQAQGYVIAIQWILLYYFDGCPSWSWFYQHHYAPYISDVRGFKDMKITFDLSRPFLPFQQLMAVLPAASKDLLPPAYQPLMTEPESPIVDFYPVDFETDLNGKQQDWEAVVLIPFIVEERLLEAMASKEHLLTREEKSRNHHGPHFLYHHTPEDMGHYPSSLPGVFPDLHFNFAKITQLDKDLFRIDANRLRKGLLDTVRLNVYFPGFPTLRFLPHTHELVKAGVKVFQHNSRGENMTLRVQSKEGQMLEQVADKLLGKVTYVGWPHLHEAKVIAIANESYRIELIEEDGNKSKKENAAISFNRRKLDQTESSVFELQARDIKERLMSRFAIDVGQTEIVVYACPMTGRTYTYGAHGTITLEKQFASDKTSFLHQMTVQDLQVEESGHTTFKTLEEVFPVGSSVFMVGNPHYGSQGKVMDVMPDIVRVRITLDVTEEPDFRNIGHSGLKGRYLNNYQAAQQIGIDSRTLARITGSVFVEKSGQNGGKVNIGLNLKFTKRGEEVPGYTKNTESGWSYSYKCVKTVEDFINKFPDLWLVVQQQNSNTDFFTEDALFPEGCITKLADVAKYLEELPCARVPRMKFGSEILDEEQVEQIERMTASLNPKPDMVVIKVKPRLLFRPLANQGCLVPDPGTDFYLYDRVVVVKSGYSVPFGRRGTIIGIPNDDEGGITPNSLYDVVFDEAFAGGITLRCSPGKGYRVPGSAMLNLTYGEFRKVQPNVDAKTGGRPQQSSYAGYSANGSGHFGGGFNNSNNAGKQPNYSDRAGSYNQIDRAALWKQQQQGFQQFQQQPVKWDKGQPLFGQVFAGQNQYVQGVGRGGSTPQPKFLTPKVQAAPPVIANRGLNQQWKASQENREAENSEFNSMWKNLQTHQNTKQSVQESDQFPQQRSVHQSHSPSRSLDQGPLTSAISQHGLQQQQTKLLQPAHSQPPSLLMSSTGQQGQPYSGQLQPQLGGLLPRQSGQMPSHPKPASSHPDASKGGGNTQSAAALIQSLFQGSSQSHSLPPGTENAEFLSVFNSLKIQNEELRRGNGENHVERIAQMSSVPAAAESVKSQADIALKQLLKIGVESSASSPSSATSIPLGAIQLSHIEDSHLQASQGTTSHTGKPAAPLYGRHLSLQELFDEANRQQQQQGEAKVEQQQQQILQSRAVMSDGRTNENRDPLAELEAYCKNTLNTGPPLYDYKSQPKQNGYIANVILPNGQRYEGSVCRTKEEASKSAASIAILCLNARPTSSHPVITGYPPGAQRPNVNRFFSANSAFSPIGIPGPNPSVLPHRPPVSTPLLFINQPPPTLPLHQLLQHQMQQQHQHQHLVQQNQQQHLVQQNQQQHVQNYGFELHQRQQMQTESQVQAQHPFQGQMNLMAATTTSNQMFGQVAPPGASSSAVIQQFIPLQVSRNQKTPNRRKDSESEGPLSSSSDIKAHNSDEIGMQILATKSAARTQNFDHSVAPKENRDKNGVVFQVASSSSLTSTASASGTPSAKSNHRRKKSRLAANFGSKFS